MIDVEFRKKGNQNRIRAVGSSKNSISRNLIQKNKNEKSENLINLYSTQEIFRY